MSKKDIEKVVWKFLLEITNEVESFEQHQQILSLNIDSLGFWEYICKIEDYYAVSLSESELRSIVTIEDIVNLIEEKCME